MISDRFSFLSYDAERTDLFTIRTSTGKKALIIAVNPQPLTHKSLTYPPLSTMRKPLTIFGAFFIALSTAEAAEQYSGIYPHLSYLNNEGECGTGAVVPWADRLWVIPTPRTNPWDQRTSSMRSLRI
jgi:hypothetical protein